MFTDTLIIASLTVIAGVLGFYVGGKIAIRQHTKNLERLHAGGEDSKNSRFFLVSCIQDLTSRFRRSK